jgi:single-strand DNA-binding protein
MNKITAAGRLAADSELRFTPAGDGILNFRMASDIGFGDKKSTNWFACTIFGKRAQALEQYLKKGQQVTVFGSLVLREWVSKEGIKNVSPDIRVDEVVLSGSKPADSASTPEQKTSNSASSRNSGAVDADGWPEDLPF